MSSGSSVRIDEIAGRVAALVAGRYGERLADAAAGLGIGERELRGLLQRRMPGLGDDLLAEVLTRVVRHFGVDPAWLVTGRYDIRSHAAAEENRADTTELRYQVHRLLTGPDRSVAIQPVKRADMSDAHDAPRAAVEWADGPSKASEARHNGAKGRDGRSGEPER